MDNFVFSLLIKVNSVIEIGVFDNEIVVYIILICKGDVIVVIDE